MEVLLLTDIPGIGRRSDVIVVGNGFALNHLLPERKALVVTPSVRRRYAEQIKQRAIQRDQEKTLQASALETVKGKTVTVTKKASKTGKLYAGLTAKHVAEIASQQLGAGIPEAAISLDEHIKTAGKHVITVKMGEQSATFTLEVKGDEKAEK
jgi:large subunit ribosomal protein L9